MKDNRFAKTAIVAVLLSTASVTAYAYSGEQYAQQAELTMSQARAKALKKVSGKIESSELEKESGGSGLRYSFDIRTPQGLREVGIDANTGVALENSAESGHTEARERRLEQEDSESENSPTHEREATERNEG